MSTGAPDSNPPAEQFLSVGELNVRYLDWDGEGPPIMALHGLASSGNWYERLAARLRTQFRVVAPDQRGHGRTTQATGGYDWQSLASDVVGVMDRLGIERAAVLGHSWGGNVAINLAAKFPQRVSRLVMIDGGFLDGHLLPDVTWESFSARFAPM
ncbi:MAG: alpha/beta fold hydrolase [Dehalococcoidia bacterium]